MKDLMIIVPLLAFMAFLYGWLNRLSEAGRPPGAPGGDPEYIWKDVLLLGDSEAVCTLLRARRRTCDVVACPVFPLLSMYRIVAAISASDGDNLLLCNLSKQRNPSCRTVALCNAAVYRELFDQPAVDAVLFDSLDLVKVLASWEVLS